MKRTITKIKCLTALFALLLSGSLIGQSITWGPSTPAGSADPLTVYLADSISQFEFVNDAVALTSPVIEVDLGTGVEYVAGKLLYTTSGSATISELSATGANPARFSVSGLAANEQVSFSFARRATCVARTHKLNGGTFGDTCRVLESGTEVTYNNNSGNSFSVPYTLTVGNLVFGPVSYAPSSSAGVGEAVTRSIDITNGSFGAIDDFWFEDIHIDANINVSDFQVNGNAIPPANISISGGTARITFDASVIVLIDGTGGTSGDGDVLFEKDEYFTLSYKVTPLNCGTVTDLQSDLKVYYGENVSTPCEPSGNAQTNVSISNGDPDITITKVSGNYIDFCLTETYQATITNNGTDPEDFAQDLIAFIGLGTTSPTSIPGDITLFGSSVLGARQFSNFKLNGQSVTLPQILGANASMIEYLAPDYFMTDPDGPGGLDDVDGDGYFDDLPAGATLTICFDVDLTPPNVPCGLGQYDYIGTEFIMMDVNWSNQCSIDQIPERLIFNLGTIRRDEVTTLIESPTDLTDGAGFDIRVQPSFSMTGSLRCDGENPNTGSDVTWSVRATLPPGVSLSSTATTDTHFAAYNPQLNQAGNVVTYSINRNELNWFTFPLEFDCAAWDGSNPVTISFETVYSCGTCYEEVIHCFDVSAVPQCPLPGCVGMTIREFTAQRTTPGWTDNSMTTPVTLDPALHAVDKIAPYDTVQWVLKGSIVDTISNNLYAKIVYTAESGQDIFNFLDGNFTIYDIDGAYGSTSYTGSLTTPPTKTHLGGGQYEWLVDLSAYRSLVSPAYQYGEGMDADSFTLVLNLVHDMNVNRGYYEVQDFRASYYMLDAESNERACLDLGNTMFYTGFEFYAFSHHVPVSGCNDDFGQFSFAWFNDAGKIFTNEYRPITHINSIVLTLPPAMEFGGQLFLDGGGDLQGKFTYTANPDNTITITPTAAYRPSEWTSLYSYRFRVAVNGKCSLEEGRSNGSGTINVTGNYHHPNPTIHETITRTSNINMTYIPATVGHTPLNPIQNTFTKEVNWDVDVCNTTPGQTIDYNWVVLDNSAFPDLSITNVYEVSGATQTLISTTRNGNQVMVPVGSIDGGECMTIRIYAENNSCEPADIEITQGWNCNAYPTDWMELVSCDTATFVRAIPEDAQISGAITPLALTPADPSDPGVGTFGSSTVDMCEQFPVEFKIISSDAASIYDIKFNVLLPNLGSGLEYVANSATIEVEGEDALNTTRSVAAAGEAIFNTTGGIWQFSLSDLDPVNFGSGEGLTGAGIDPGQNEITIRWMMEVTCEMVSGDNIIIESFALSPCSDPAIGNADKVLSSPLNITGVVLPYTSTISTSISPDGTFRGCGDVKTIAIEAGISGGTTGANDTLFIELTEGLDYEGNLTCSAPSCVTFGGSKMVDGKEVLAFIYPAGVVNENVNFAFDIVSNGVSDCNADDISMKSTAQIAGLTCGTSTCPTTKVITGSTLSGITLEMPEYQIALNSVTPTGTGGFDYELVVTNFGDDGTDSISVDFYCLDSNLDFDESAGIITTIKTDSLLSGESVTLSGTLNSVSCDVTTYGLGVIISPESGKGEANCFCTDLTLNDFPKSIITDVLPVELASFTGVGLDCIRRLEWVAASEIAFDYYEIQRSVDGKDFEILESVQGRGSATERTTYKYQDEESMCYRQLFYQLKMVDLDGSFEWSEMISVENKCKDQELSVKPYPNPVNDILNLRSSKGDCHNLDAEVQVIDPFGRIVAEFELDSENEELTLDVSSFAHGLYYVRVIQEGVPVFSSKFLVAGD